MLRNFWDTIRKEKKGICAGDSYVHCQAGYLNVQCAALFSRERKLGGHWQKWYNDMHRNMVQTATRELIGNGMNLVKHWSWGDVKVEQGGLSSGKKSDAVMKISRTANKIWTVSSISKKIDCISWWEQVSWRTCLGLRTTATLKSSEWRPHWLHGKTDRRYEDYREVE